MKKTIRKDILAKRIAQSNTEVAVKSAVIQEKLLPYWDKDEVKTIMVYLPFRKEVNLTPLIEAAWSKGKKIAIPVCKEEFTIVPSLIYDFEEDLEPGLWNILEPKKDKMRPVAPEDLDLVIVPGVAFDKGCNRLGYGAGYYDRFLPRLRQGVPFIAVCFELQMQENVCPDCHDVPMYMVITEENVYQNK